MTDERNFERITRAWLDLMPDEAPDRTIAAVLQAVETTPQVRWTWRRLSWRPSPMKRIPFAIGAAAVAVIAGAFFFANSGRGPDVGTPPSPSPSASASPTGSPLGAGGPLPAELRHTWMSDHRDVTGILTSAGTALFLADRSFAISQSNQNERKFLTSSASAPGAGQVTLVTDTAAACAKGDTGLYSWSLSPSGRILTITTDLDNCAVRNAAFGGTWWQVACKNTNTNCLGDLDPGTYRSQYITPRLDPGATWEPDFGALTYTVPDGWANVDDFPGSFGLMPSTDYAGMPDNDTEAASIYLFTQPQAMSQATPCSGEPDVSVDRSVGGLIAWLKNVPGLVVTDASPMTIDNNPATVVNIQIDPSWTTGCGGGTTPEVSYLTPEFGIFGLEARQRLILVDLGGGDVLGIGTVALVDRFDAFLLEATPIIESFQIE
jgi:hypothetical protein